MPVEGELAHQNIKDRYYGVNDPVAKKMLNRVKEKATLHTPSDKDIKTLYIGNVDSRITEEDLRYFSLLLFHMLQQNFKILSAFSRTLSS
jgi:pre-mRNA-splicing factor RBM22/SLT11